MSTFHATEVAAALVVALQAVAPEYDVCREMPETNAVKPGKLAVLLPDFTQASGGMNHTAQQTYRLVVAGAHRDRSAATPEAVEELASRLVNAVAADPYLQETCWHAAVTRVVFGANGYMRMTVVAKRSEVFPS